VILEPYAVGELLSFLGYLGFNSLAVQEERSFFCNQIGKKLVDEKVTIFDDGLDPLGLQVPFDFEGVPKRKVRFFEKGIAREVTYDSFTAGREGKASTGHGLIAPNTAGPVPINLFMSEGDASLSEMVRSIRKGVYVTRFHYTNVVEPMKAVITGMTRDGTFLIEDGEIKRPIKNLRFTESILRTLSRIRAVSRDRRLCSEGNDLFPAFCDRHRSSCPPGGGFQFFRNLITVAYSDGVLKYTGRFNPALGPLRPCPFEQRFGANGENREEMDGGDSGFCEAEGLRLRGYPGRSAST